MDLSIIIPVYNVEKYIIDCLSPLTALSDLNFEIIIVNDGSRDNSISFAIDFLSKSSLAFLIIDQENTGLAAARNTGFEVATGKYIYFYDSDDFIIPRDFLILWKEAKDNDLDICSGKGMIYFEDGSLQVMKEDKVLKNTKILTGPEYFQIMDHNKEFSPSVPLRIFRRSFLLGNSIHFTEGVIHEDEEYTALCFAKAERCAYFPFAFYRYRFRPGSITKSSDHKYLNERSIPSFSQIAHNLIGLPTYSSSVQVVYHRSVARFLEEILRRHDYLKQKKIIREIPHWSDLGLDSVMGSLQLKFRLPIYRLRLKIYLKQMTLIRQFQDGLGRENSQ